MKKRPPAQRQRLLRLSPEITSHKEPLASGGLAVRLEQALPFRR